MRETAKLVGFSEDDLSQVTDHRTVMILHKAAMWDALQKKTIKPAPARTTQASSKGTVSKSALKKAKEKLKSDYLSVIHADNTCRTQVIDNENSFIFKLLKKLGENNINILVNTSFNISKDPMVFDLFDVYINMRRMNIEYETATTTKT